MLGLQLGFTYPAECGLSVDDGSPLLEPDDAVRDYLPATRPGCRLPHAWIDRAGERVSTLDLVPLDRFVLLTASTAWAEAGEQAARAAVPLDVVLFGRDVLDPDGNWARVGGIDGTGAILVRPDQHVGWRAFGEGTDPVNELREALARLTAAGA